MKRSIPVLLTLLACLTVFSACGKKNGEAPAQELPDDVGTGTAQDEGQAQETGAKLSDYYGCWEDGDGRRVSMTVAPREEQGDVEVVIHRSVSAREMDEWILHGTPDAESGALSYADGQKNRVTWDAGLSEKTEPVRKSGSGTLALADGVLKWTDAEEADSATFRFERAAAELPAAQELVDGYFRPVAGKSADGGELSPERSACEALRFAYLIDAFSQDSSEMRVVLRFAWESMSKEEQESFLKGFSGVVPLIDKAMSDPASVRGAFDAAGVGGEMKDLVDSAYCRACWASLRDDTVNMDSNG